MKKIARKKWILILESLIILAGSFVLPSFAVAQEATGAVNGDVAVEATTTEVATDQATQESVPSGRGWRIVQILAFIGLLLALAGVIYGIVLWKNSTQNNDLLGVEKGRRLAVLSGLIFIICLILLIVSFVVLRRIKRDLQPLPPQQAITSGQSGFQTFDALLLVETIPLGEVPIRNVAVQMIFNQNITQLGVQENILVKKNEDQVEIVGDWEVEGSVAIFRPNSTCPSPNTNLHCFEANTLFDVVISKELTSLDGDSFRCSVPSKECAFSFVTGELVDVQSPTVALTLPTEGEGVPVDSSVLLEGLGSDDVGVAYLQFFADDEIVGVAAVESGKVQTDFRGASSWLTSELLIGSEHPLQVKVYDIAGFSGESVLVNVEILPLHCFDEVKNEDETAIDCGGDSCRACDGLACTENNECASGLCFNGTCESFPIIEDIINDNGAPGNLVTLRGKNFGKLLADLGDEGETCVLDRDCKSGSCTEGTCAQGEALCNNEATITFLGGASDDDDVIGWAPSCSQYWSDNEVIIVVPPNAVTGPLRITNSCNLYDTTSDDKGIRQDFEINDINRPGLCGVTPDTQSVGEKVQLQGVGLGDDGEISFGGFNSGSIGAWSNELISEVVVPSIDSAKVPVQVHLAGEASNPVSLQVLASPTIPHIVSISPDRGPVGQMFSIQGENFSPSILVKFFNPRTGETTLAATNIPDSCLDYQPLNQRAFRVPKVEQGIYQIFVESEDGTSNSLDFTVTGGERIPGLCALTPDNGPVGVEITLHGEAFGGQQGGVRFQNRVDDASIIAWSDSKIIVLVPPAAISGPVQAIKEDGTLSNAMNYTVSQCSPDGAQPGFECCTNGAYQPSGTCVNVVPMCTYSWLFGTGTDLGGAPRVIEEATCKGNTQSASPYKGTTDACLNAGVSARFTHDMQNETLNGNNVVLRKCNTGPVFDVTTCSTTISLSSFTIINSGQTGEGFMAYPPGRLEPDTWYQGEISTEVQAANSLNMAQPYLWNFKTQEGNSECEIDHVEVTPPTATLRKLSIQQQYTGVPIALNCNVLDGRDYSWRWLSANSGKATVVPTTDPVTKATSIAATDPGPPIEIFGAIPQFDEEDAGLLTVSLRSPEVIAQWPNCKLACNSAIIGARFDQEMSESSINKPGNIQLLSCADETCARGSLNGVGISSLEYNSVDSEIYFLSASQVLVPDTTYRAVLKGLRGSNGLALAGLNFDADGDGGLDSFSWIFKVRSGDEPCTVASVKVVPPFVESYLMSETFDYFSFPLSAPDTCSADGQMLNPLQFNWGWDSGSTDVAEVTSKDDRPPSGSIDPIQITTSIGKGKTGIKAQTEGKTGEGSFEVICGYQDDSACPAPATINSHAVGTDTCCYPRPVVVSSVPDNGASQVCTTLAIEVQFNQEMQDTSLISNMVLEIDNGATACAGTEQVTAWGHFKRLARKVFNWAIPTIDAQAINFCEIESGVTVSSNNLGSIARLTPKAQLEKNRSYRVRVKGDKNLTDGIPEGVRNSFGVSMLDDYAVSFQTGEAKCSLDYVEVNIDPPGEAGVKDVFFCAVRNDCAGDTNAAVDGNQHTYKVTGRDRRGFIVPSEFTWSQHGEGVISINSQEGDQIEATPGQTNGRAGLTVYGEALAPSEGSVSRSMAIKVFICENPWPSIRDFPYVDDIFNYDLFYCRDFGEPGVYDDLPALASPIIESEIPGVLRESIFVIE